MVSSRRLGVRGGLAGVDGMDGGEGVEGKGKGIGGGGRKEGVKST